MLLSAHIHQHPNPVTLTYVSNGLDAIAKLQAGMAPCLLLVDAQMPLMDGYELLMWLMGSEVCRPIPVIIWTGNMTDVAVAQYKQAGAKLVILKEDALHDVNAFYDQWLKIGVAA